MGGGRLGDEGKGKEGVPPLASNSALRHNSVHLSEAVFKLLLAALILSELKALWLVEPFPGT